MPWPSSRSTTVTATVTKARESDSPRPNSFEHPGRHVEKPWKRSVRLAGSANLGQQLADPSVSRVSLSVRVSAVRRVAFRRFPEEDFHDRQSGVACPVEDELGDVLGSGVCRHHEDAFAPLLEDGQDRVVLGKAAGCGRGSRRSSAGTSLDLPEIDEHPPIVKLWCFQGDHGEAVMTVKVAALAVVVDAADGRSRTRSRG